MPIKSIVELIMKRDNLSRGEAENLVDCCRADLHTIVENDGSYDDAEECIADWLGLEPDYMEILLM